MSTPTTSPRTPWIMIGGTLFLQSGKWRWGVDESTGGSTMLELVDPRQPANKMSTTLPFGWRQLGSRQLAALAREPEMRLWLDEAGILWRVSVVGPGTHYPYDFQDRHLVFDSAEAWAGWVEFPDGRLGDITDAELRAYRSRMRDFGGRRHGYRRPGL